MDERPRTVRLAPILLALLLLAAALPATTATPSEACNYLGPSYCRLAGAVNGRATIYVQDVTGMDLPFEVCSGVNGDGTCKGYLYGEGCGTTSLEDLPNRPFYVVMTLPKSWCLGVPAWGLISVDYR